MFKTCLLGGNVFSEILVWGGGGEGDKRGNSMFCGNSVGETWQGYSIFS